MFNPRNWPRVVRYILYTCSFAGVWAIFSLHHLIQNRPVEFQSAGSIVVAYSVFFLARSRVRFERSLARAQEALISTALSRLEAHRARNETRLQHTFNLYGLQIAQISDHLDVPCPVGPDNAESAQRIAKELEEYFSQGNELPALKEDTDAIRAQERLISIQNEVEPWARFIWSLEVFFIILGTLQWGYGNEWVELLHTNKDGWSRAFFGLWQKISE